MKDENDHVDVHELRGFASDNLMGALNETYAISRGTQCKQFLYSLSLNPPPSAKVDTGTFIKTIDEVEKRLKLEGQPRAIVFHEKEGRRHAHAVWSRIDIQEMKAIQMSYDHTKLMEYSRELYLEHGWKMPRGLAKQSERDPRNFTLADWQQAKRIKQHPNDIDRAIQDAWAISDTKATFVHALNERGYALAKGDRKGRIVAVDTFGEIYSVPKKVGTRIKQVRERVGDEQHLPSIDEAKHKIANGMLPTLESFKASLDRKREQENTQYKHERQDLIEWQRRQRTDFLSNQRQQTQQEAITRNARFRTGIKGVWDRLRGEHKRIRLQNEQEAKLSLEKAQTVKDQFIQKQLSERRMLMLRHKTQQQQQQVKQRELKQDIKRYKQGQPERIRETPVIAKANKPQNVGLGQTVKVPTKAQPTKSNHTEAKPVSSQFITKSNDVGEFKQSREARKKTFMTRRKSRKNIKSNVRDFGW